MWIKKDEIDEIRVSQDIVEKAYIKRNKYFIEPRFLEHKNILIVDGLYLKILFENIEDVHTTFVKIGKKVTDIYGGLTGVGLKPGKYYSLIKKAESERTFFESSILLPYISDDLELIVDHFLEFFPKEILDGFKERIFLTFSKIDISEMDAEKLPEIKIPESFKGNGCNNIYLYMKIMVLK